jgi:tetratricopeptide (TPR) repeat protein
MEELNRAIERNPRDAVAYSDRGYLHCKSGDFQKGMIDFEKAIELDPRNPAPRNGRGSVYLVAGDFSRAITDFTKAIKLRPEFSSAYFTFFLDLFWIGIDFFWIFLDGWGGGINCVYTSKTKFPGDNRF